MSKQISNIGIKSINEGLINYKINYQIGDDEQYFIKTSDIIPIGFIIRLMEFKLKISKKNDLD